MTAGGTNDDHEQYTTVHDMDGEELYVGDLVAFYFDGVYAGDLAQIVFKNGCFVCKCVDRDNTHSSSILGFCVKKVGTNHTHDIVP